MFPVAKLVAPRHAGCSHTLFHMAATNHITVLMLGRPRRNTYTMEDKKFVHQHRDERVGDKAIS
jgi:hypothetical protein